MTISLFCYNVMATLCGFLLQVQKSPRGRTRVPFLLVGDVVAYQPSPGEAFPTSSDGDCLPLPPLGDGICQLVYGGSSLVVGLLRDFYYLKMKE